MLIRSDRYLAIWNSSKFFNAIDRSAFAKDRLSDRWLRPCWKRNQNSVLHCISAEYTNVTGGKEKENLRPGSRELVCSL